MKKNPALENFIQGKILEIVLARFPLGLLHLTCTRGAMAHCDAVLGLLAALTGPRSNLATAAENPTRRGVMRDSLRFGVPIPCGILGNWRIISELRSSGYLT